MHFSTIFSKERGELLDQCCCLSRSAGKQPHLGHSSLDATSSRELHAAHNNPWTRPWHTQVLTSVALIDNLITGS